jgi:CheY-like chemotaxis protein
VRDAYTRATEVADAALSRLRKQVAALLAHDAPRTFRSERTLRRSRRTPAILYVDDDPFTRFSGQMLREAFPGCMVSVVTTAEEAMRAARAEAWTIAVLDLHLGHPNLTGLDVLADLPTTTRVVLVTGVAKSELSEIARRVEVDAHLEKPFSPEALFRVVAGLLAQPETVTP